MYGKRKRENQHGHVEANRQVVSPWKQLRRIAFVQAMYQDQNLIKDRTGGMNRVDHQVCKSTIFCDITVFGEEKAVMRRFEREAAYPASLIGIGRSLGSHKLKKGSGCVVDELVHNRPEFP